VVWFLIMYHVDLQCAYDFCSLQINAHVSNPKGDHDVVPPLSSHYMFLVHITFVYLIIILYTHSLLHTSLP
jgi:hypothetical protein